MKLKNGTLVICADFEAPLILSVGATRYLTPGWYECRLPNSVEAGYCYLLHMNEMEAITYETI